MVAACVISTVAAQAADLQAQLSRAATAVGSPVSLQVRIEGSGEAELPSEIKADGLQIRLTGKSTQVSVVNFKMSASVVYTYTILPERQGKFSIPSIPVRVDGKTSHTPELALSVEPGAGGPAPRTPGMPGSAAQPLPGAAVPQRAAPGSVAPKGIAYAELIVPKKSAYVGEVVPVEIRLYFDPRFSPRPTGRPVFSGDGFTIEELAEPARSEQMINGTPYVVFSIQSAITPLKSGELEIPAVSLDCAVQTGRSNLPSQFESMFRQFLGGMPPGFGDEEEMTVKSDSVKLLVKALPKEGRPGTFTGAVGEFDLSMDASPKKAAAGDPITLRVDVTGRGNFKAMSEPVLTGTEGWRVYPPATKFEPADRVGFGGTKTFESMVVAQEEKTRTPGVTFSYFDPTKEKYVTLDCNAIPVAAAGQKPSQVAGGSDANQAPKSTAAPAAAAAATPRPASERQVLDSYLPRSFKPLVYDTGYLAATGAGAAALLGLLAFQVYRRAQAGESARRQQIRRAQQRTLAALDRDGVSDNEFLENARDLLADEIARATGSTLAGVDEFALKLGLDAGAREQLHEIIERADELKYGGGVAVRIAPDARKRITGALRQILSTNAQ